MQPAWQFYPSEMRVGAGAPARHLRSLGSWKPQFWLPAPRSHMAAPRDGGAGSISHPSQNTFCAKRDSRSPSSSNLNSFVLHRVLSADYCTAPAQRCSEQLKYLRAQEMR